MTRGPTENRDIQWFVKNVGHFVLKVLGSHCGVKHKKSKKRIFMRRNARRTKRIQKLLPVFAFQGDDFTASAADIGVEVECLPKMINRARTRHRTDVKQDANIGLENGAKSIKEPTVGIDLLLVLLFETKDDLYGHNTFLRAFDLVRRRNGDCEGSETIE
jgi:hypothetical protein